MPTGLYTVLSTYWKRKLRQAQGQLENLAVQEHMAFKKRPPQDLPLCNKSMVVKYVDENRAKVRKIVMKNPLVGYALHRVRNSVAVSATPSVTRQLSPAD